MFCTKYSSSIKFFLVPVSEAHTMLANLGQFTVAWHTNSKKSQQLEMLAVKSHDEFLAEVSCEMPRSPYRFKSFKVVLKRGLVSAADDVDINLKGTGQRRLCCRKMCCIHAIAVLHPLEAPHVLRFLVILSSWLKEKRMQSHNQKGWLMMRSSYFAVEGFHFFQGLWWWSLWCFFMLQLLRSGRHPTADGFSLSWDFSGWRSGDAAECDGHCWNRKPLWYPLIQTGCLNMSGMFLTTWKDVADPQVTCIVPPVPR